MFWHAMNANATVNVNIDANVKTDVYCGHE